MKRHRYTYSILRYRHDPIAGEQLNVGVVLHSPDRLYLGARFRKNYGRLSKAFPDVDGSTLRQDLSRIEKAFERLTKMEGSDLFSIEKNAASFATRVVGPDDGSLIWSDLGSGTTESPEATLDKLFARMVTQYEDSTTPRRTDADVWRPVRDRLMELKVASILEKKTIASSKDEVEFEHAWKNGKWHCYQPLSFDLATVDSIQEKAARWVGHMVGLSSASEKFHPYFIVGKPSEPTLQSAYRRALDFIADAPLQPTIVPEEEVEAFANDLADRVHSHERR
ncbi:DUF3037 domain-containing protein [Bradyrhizobium japonicum]|uniref:DUF3037 domain-containing protein n=1 Tax=Bradyrhizobium japonicum TaxID=375 RepID=UPI00200D28D9|nr:DUF3037 domain-containing protein [Bradyrhizobium japonicum]UQD99354.1 DUF3037 domain-containing protein [Bradyrhizobium japonicum]WLB19347.1 DUF3037 domain-containing protein [Bradyrhizobium japonicum]